MDLTILGEYGLKTALRVALNIKKLYTSEVDNGIISAFELALNDWSKHPPTASDKVRLSKALEEYIQSSMSYEALDPDTRAFIDYFKKRLSEQPAAHNYLMTLRSDMQAISEEQNLLEHYKTQELVRGLIAQMKGFNMDPEDIQVLLEELPLKRGLECTKLALEEMLEKRRIPSEEVKQLFLEFVRFHLEEIAKRGEEAKQLRVAGDSYLAENLEEINRVLTGESEQSLTAVHKKCQEQAKQNEIRLLEELIEAALIKFSFGEVRDFYERLIELAPTPEHHFNYARLLHSLNDFEKARRYYEKALHELRMLVEQNPEVYKVDLAMLLNNLGVLFGNTNELKQAQTCYEEALHIRRELARKNPEAYKPNVAATLDNMGALYNTTNELKQAQTCYEEALHIRRELARKNPEAYKPNVAVTLNNLGVLHRDTNEFKQAQICYEEALQICEELAEQNPEIYKPNVAATLNNLGALLRDINEFKQAQTCHEKVLQIYRELAKQNPEAYKPNIAIALNNLGALLRDINEFKQAQTCYEEALQIYQELLEKTSQAYLPYVAMTLNNLGNLLFDTNELHHAQAYYKEALQVCRELSEHNPEAYMPDVAMSLNNLGVLLQITDELQQACVYHEEALEIRRELSEHNQEAYKQDLATTQQNLALLYLQQGKEEDAEKAYQEAHDIYQELAGKHPRAYEIDYAKILVMGFDLLGKPKEYLEEAKEILGKHPKHPQAQELLSTIEELA